MSERPQQKQRTRQDLLRAAAKLTSEGKKPSLEEIAAEAMVSRATAYRYFPNIETLLLEAALEVDAPDPTALFGPGAPADAQDRVLLVDDALHRMTRDNETVLRMFLGHALQQHAGLSDGDAPPRRQNRRAPLLARALEPLDGRLPEAQRRLLTRALALIVGGEAIFVCDDVLGLSDAETREVKAFAIRALIAAALREQP